MAVTLYDDLSVCIDCALLIANDDAEPEHRAAFQAHSAQYGGTLVLTCGGDEEGCEDHFSTAPCDGCGSVLGGERHAAAVIG